MAIFFFFFVPRLISVPAKLVWVAENRSAELPCDATPMAGDAVKLVLWFKDTTGIPIYR